MRSTISWIATSIASLFSFFLNAQESQDEISYSTPEQIATLSSEPSYLIGDIVSPISGEPVLGQTDLIVHGAQDLRLSRVYIPPYIPSFPYHKHYQKEWEKYYLSRYLPGHYKGWQFYPHLFLIFDSNTQIVYFTEPHGASLQFSLGQQELLSSKIGLSNLVNDEPSGKYDARNIQLEKRDNEIVIHAPDGTDRIYTFVRVGGGWNQVFYLTKEILPNGKLITYHYEGGGKLNRIESRSPNGEIVYAALHFENSETHCQFISSTGSKASFDYEIRKLHGKIKQDGKSHISFSYSCPSLLTSAHSPFYQDEKAVYCDKFLLCDYSSKDEIFKLVNGCFGEKLYYRVAQIHRPVGDHDAFFLVHELSYQPPIPGEKPGTTTVKNRDGTTIIYHITPQLLIDKIQYFDHDQLKREKLYIWGEDNRLNSLMTQDGKGNLLSTRSYSYDALGNPIVEQFSGDLSGMGKTETYSIYRKFSERNLLLEERTEDGKVTTFAYLPGTNLLISKLTKDQSRILVREFFLYDEHYNCTKKILDNGDAEDADDLSGVTQRNMTTYRLRREPPFLHMVEWIEKSYLEDGREKLLTKKHLTYDAHGNIAEEAIYDADGECAYTIYKTYNKRGDLLSETNALSQKATHSFDERGRKISSTNFSGSLKKYFSYDAKGRLCKLTEAGSDTTIHTTCFTYDPYDRTTSKKDFFGNRTHYAYDSIVGGITKTDFPSTQSIDGTLLKVTTASTFDALGRETSKTNENGHTTFTSCNAYGSPTHICYPDGSEERFIYEKNGQLLTYIGPDGLETHYERDILGRVLAKTFMKNREILATETFVYDAFHLLQETDREGNSKHFIYDGAGRKIREAFCNKHTSFHYDPLNRLDAITELSDSNTLVIHFKRDLEERILEERKTDLAGNLLYCIAFTYDVDGNKDSITRWINGKEAAESFTFDSFQRRLHHIDAEGYATTTTYNETCKNAHGQNVLQVTTTDPRHVATIITHNALSQPIHSEKTNSQGQAISAQEMHRDAKGNLLYQKDHVYEEGNYLYTQTVQFAYTPTDRLQSLTRGFGTQDARTTTYTYLSTGKIKSKTLPSRTALTFTYNALGFPEHLDSSDGTIHHAFTYNKLGHLLTATDENQNLTISRIVDPFGNTLQEIFPSGLYIEKTYDNRCRLTSLKTTMGEIRYSNNPLFVRRIDRCTQSGEILYSHLYDEYDEDGNLVAETLPGNLGRCQRKTTPRCQIGSISSPYFSQVCGYDEVGNLTSSRIDGAIDSYNYDDHSQLISENKKTYLYDSLFNRTEKNGASQKINPLNELLSSGESEYQYDQNGNRTFQQNETSSTSFTYDALNQLIEVTSDAQKVQFVYDPLGRRLSKTTYKATALGWKEESYETNLYHEQIELGAFTKDLEPKNFRITSPQKTPSTIAIEMGGHVLATFLDNQGNIRKLIDPLSKSIVKSYNYSSFGEANFEIQDPNPWRYAAKRFDPELGLIYFGKRYYDPSIGRWLTTDPAGFTDSPNLYQYVFNNPFRYHDPDGQFIIALPLLALTWQAVAAAAVTAYVAYELEHQHQRSNSALARSFNSTLHQIVQNIGGVSQYELNQKLSMKKKQIDERLPKNPDEILNDPDWKETTHPEAGEKGHRKFENVKTGEKLLYDEAKPGESGHKAEAHWHRFNPKATNRHDRFLDANDNPVRENSDPSHLYAP